MSHEVLSDGSVNRWNASYYENSAKKWIYGTLHLLPNALFFEAKNVESKNEPNECCEIFIKFSVISLIKKASSSLIYPSIAVISTNNATHWFSSFGNRDSVLLMIEHFFHSFLLTGNSGENVADEKFPHTQSSQKSSRLGTELLQSITDTHETLKTAASKLNSQGQQLRNDAHTMVEIRDNLGYASRLTKGLDSWFGRWKVPKLVPQEAMHLVDNKDIPYGFHFEVLCSEIKGFKYGQPKECVLRLVKEGLTILDKKQKILHHFEWGNVSRLQVSSPWEITISQFLVGAPDISYSITAVEVPTVIQELTKFIPQKMEFMNYANNPTLSAEGRDGKRKYNRNELGVSSGTATAEFSSEGHKTSSLGSLETGLQRQEKGGKIMTDSEMNQLSSTLSTLKSLAMDIQKEEDKQLQTLDDLLVSVDKGNDKLKHLNKKINVLSK